MVKGLYIAYTGMIHEQQRMDIMTNNLANADTTGFKKEGATSQAFTDVLALKIKDISEGGSGRNVRPEGMMQPGVKIGENYVDYTEGPLKETENVFDLALSDKGFFAIEFTNKAGVTSTKYTRDGNFTLNTNGDLVNQNGDYVLSSTGGHIRIDPLLETKIDRQGQIWQNENVVARIGVTDFADYDYLARYGENYFETIEGAEEIQPDTEIYSGYLEMANMSVVTEMVNMIAISRQY
ncbi:MAG: flagellar hook-basal body protein, partial [Lachnospiraceae bacterium]|nr:flagellar hook-basal body protein [Lachnospiraceae bacterium]